MNIFAEPVFEAKKGVKMGLLSAGEPLDWEDMVQWQDHVRKYGVQQFIRLYNRLKVQFFKNELRRKSKLPYKVWTVLLYVYTVLSTSLAGSVECYPSPQHYT